MYLHQAAIRQAFNVNNKNFDESWDMKWLHREDVWQYYHERSKKMPNPCKARY